MVLDRLLPKLKYLSPLLLPVICQNEEELQNVANLPTVLLDDLHRVLEEGGGVEAAVEPLLEYEGKSKGGEV